ncbi:PH domain-containing protein [Bacillus massiliigorillae]|uniref:PH domain-containing protein n=1 Tax=Bacillus massiliigorillae TaxID=1243664 RepID=UPI00039BB5E8|nr:PH domain-containing protein [Bacillus massiliigorillae]
MLNKKEVREQLVQIEKKYNVNLDMYRSKLAFKDLPAALYADEVMKFVTTGYYDGNTYMFVCTNKRILALDKGMLYKLRVEEIPMNKIQSVSFKKKLIFAEVNIVTDYAEIKIDQVYKDQVQFFAEAIKEAKEQMA